LLTLDPGSAVAAIASFRHRAWLIVRVRGRLTARLLARWPRWSQMTSILADAIPGIRVVKAFLAGGSARSSRFRARANSASSTSTIASTRSGRSSGRSCSC
jgi:ATP-binding cassette subfamily B protein